MPFGCALNFNDVPNMPNDEQIQLDVWSDHLFDLVLDHLELVRWSNKRVRTADLPLKDSFHSRWRPFEQNNVINSKEYRIRTKRHDSSEESQKMHCFSGECSCVWCDVFLFQVLLLVFNVGHGIAKWNAHLHGSQTLGHWPTRCQNDLIRNFVRGREKESIFTCRFSANVRCLIQRLRKSLLA